MFLRVSVSDVEKGIWSNNNTGPKSLFISEGNLHGGLGSRSFRVTPTRWCGNGCRYVRPHPRLTNLEFRSLLLLPL